MFKEMSTPVYKRSNYKLRHIQTESGCPVLTAIHIFITQILQLQHLNI